MRGQRIDLKGRRFGRLVAVADVGSDRQGGRVWHCECDCGGFVKSSCHTLVSGFTKSCGCLRRDKARVHGLDLAMQRGMIP